MLLRGGYCLRAPLPKRHHQSVEISGKDQSDLAARHREHRPVLIGQQDRAPAGTDRGARAGRDIDTINIGRPSDVADGPEEIARRGAKGETISSARRLQADSTGREISMCRCRPSRQRQSQP